MSFSSEWNFVSGKSFTIDFVTPHLSSTHLQSYSEFRDILTQYNWVLWVMGPGSEWKIYVEKLALVLLFAMRSHWKSIYFLKNEETMKWVRGEVHARQICSGTISSIRIDSIYRIVVDWPEVVSSNDVSWFREKVVIWESSRTFNVLYILDSWIQ